jgi:DNA polymerase-4
VERHIAHLDVDDFYIACERAINSKLVRSPLIIGGGKDRGLVAACSSEARLSGVRRMMPVGLALQLCPTAKLVQADLDLYTKYSHTITEIIKEEAPVTEKAGIDEFYLDLTGMDRFFGCYKWTDELVQKIKKESGLSASFGLSINKTVSKIADVEGKATGKRQVQTEEVRSFLNPLSIEKIPLVGSETYQLLSRIGIRKIQNIAETPVDLLQELLGKNGREIWKRSHGIDTEPVEPYSERKSISAEHVFEKDTIDVKKVKLLLVAMVEKLAFQLRQEAWLASSIHIRIRYTNFDTQSKQCKIPYTSCDHLMLRQVNDLFDKTYDRRMRLRLISLKFSGLIRGAYQINLFEDTTEHIALYQAIDKLKQRFGFNSIVRCAGMHADSIKD